jgi:hypothetical protein
MGHACHVLPGWNRDISEPVWRCSGSSRFRRAGGCCAHLGHRQRKFRRRFGRRLRARYNQGAEGYNDDTPTEREPARIFHVSPPRDGRGLSNLCGSRPYSAQLTLGQLFVCLQPLRGWSSGDGRRVAGQVTPVNSCPFWELRVAASIARLQRDQSRAGSRASAAGRASPFFSTAPTTPLSTGGDYGTDRISEHVDDLGNAGLRRTQ